MKAAFKRCLHFEKPNSIKWWVDYTLLNSGHFLPYSPTLLRGRHYQNTNFIASILAGVFWSSSSFRNLNNTFGNYQSITTQASSSEGEQDDDLLNQIISKVDHSPNLAVAISSTHIEKLCCENNFSVAFRLFQSLQDRHIFLEAKAYNLLLVAAYKANNIRLLSRIFKDFLVSTNPISTTSYLNLAKAFKGVKDDSSLLEFITEVSDLTFPRSATVINRIIYAFDVCGQMDRALLIYDHMKSLKCKPDLITYNTVLGILGRVGRGDEMLQEFSLMKEAKIIPDIVSYNTLINSFRKLGRLDMCSVFLEEVKQEGLELDLRTYTALIECFGHSGNIEESLSLFNEMKSKRIRHSVYIYRSLINNAKKLGKTELALRFLEEMNASLHNLVGPKDFKRKKR